MLKLISINILFTNYIDLEIISAAICIVAAINVIANGTVIYSTPFIVFIIIMATFK